MLIIKKITAHAYEVINLLTFVYLLTFIIPLNSGNINMLIIMDQLVHTKISIKSLSKK